MSARLKLDFVPQAYQAMRGLQSFVNDSGLDHGLLQLIEVRASQINGCAFCIAMHVSDARKLGGSTTCDCISLRALARGADLSRHANARRWR